MVATQNIDTLGPVWPFSLRGVLTFVASGLDMHIYSVTQAVHSLLYIVAKCHFFSFATWKYIIKYLQKCEECTHLCEILCVCVYIYFNIYFSHSYTVYHQYLPSNILNETRHNEGRKNAFTPMRNTSIQLVSLFSVKNNKRLESHILLCITTTIPLLFNYSVRMHVHCNLKMTVGMGISSNS